MWVYQVRWEIAFVVIVFAISLSKRLLSFVPGSSHGF